MYASASWIQHLWDMVLHRTSQIIPKFYPHIHIIITYITYIYIYICWMFLLFNMWIEPIKTWMSDKFTTSYGIFFLQDDVWQAHELQLHKKTTSSPINLIRLVYPHNRYFNLCWKVFDMMCFPLKPNVLCCSNPICSASVSEDMIPLDPLNNHVLLYICQILQVSTPFPHTDKYHIKLVSPWISTWSYYTW